MPRIAFPLCLLALLIGCGVKIDLDRDPGKLRSDIRRASAEDVMPHLEALDARIAQEQAALAALDERLESLAPDVLFGDQAEDLARELTEREDILARLRAQRSVYAHRLDAIAAQQAAATDDS